MLKFQSDIILKGDEDILRNIPGGAKRPHVFQIIVTLFIFNIKKLCQHQTTCNKCSLITYINYSITENYIGKMASFLPYTHPEPLLKVLHHIYLPAISFFEVTSNQKSTFENLIQSTIRKFPFAKKLQLCHKKCQ